MEKPVIKISNLNKTYLVKQHGNQTIRDHVKNIFSRSNNKYREIQALKNINLTINRGEFFGVIGRNGSGKSSLLNIIIGAIRADKGSHVATRGKIIRLALGMGFDPNLTARDNIYVNASILGLTFKRIGLIFDDIVGFAELEDFVDVAIKHYSSGMMAKLKFSIAIYAEADIFLMDEFFGGVGDESFRKKSEKIFEETFLDGRTIIHVSHQLGTIKKHCSRVLLLNKGDQLAIGTPKEIIPIYKSLFPGNKKNLQKQQQKKQKLQKLQKQRQKQRQQQKQKLKKAKALKDKGDKSV